MSALPHIALVVGLPTPVERTHIAKSEDVVPELSIPGGTTHVKEAPLHDLLYVGSLMQYSVENPGPLIGHIADRLDPYASVTRAVAAIIDSELSTLRDGGYIELPPCGNREMRWHRSWFKSMGKRRTQFSEGGKFSYLDPDKIERENRCVQLFSDHFSFYLTDKWWRATEYVLRFAGWKINREDLRLYLTYTWA